MADDGYLRELLEEKDTLDPNNYVHSIRLLEDEIIRLTGKTEERRDYGSSSRDEENDREHDRGRDRARDGDGPNKKPRYRSYAGGVVVEEVVKLSEKVVVPVKEYPKFNFVGKLLGPRGNTLKRLQQATQTRMSVLGKGSTRDKIKEEELRSSDDQKYAHLKEPLHVLIEVEAQKSEAHARLAAALAEIKKYMVPENDEIRQDQMREMALLNNYEKNPESGTGTIHTSPTAVLNRSRHMNTPIVRVGIPPPGAIILNGQQSLGVRGGRVSRIIGRGRPTRSVTVPRHAAPAPDPYAYDAYDNTYDATYEGYPDSGEAVYYEYTDDYGSPSSGRREKRAGGPPPSYGKKYRADPYADVTYPDGDLYRSTSMR